MPCPIPARSQGNSPCPSYRADMWAELDADPTLSAAELARRTYGSFATAWNVKHDWQLLAEVVGR